MIVGWNLAVGVLFELGEQFRFRAVTDPITMSIASWLVWRMIVHVRGQARRRTTIGGAMKLLTPLSLGSCEAPNRVMFGPHVTNLGDDQRRFTPRHTAYYERRAAGGCGIVVTEGASVHDSDWPYERAPLAAPLRRRLAGDRRRLPRPRRVW